MKIRTQSVILIAGVILMPLIVISLSLVVGRISFAAKEAQRYESLKLEGPAVTPEERVRRIIREKPDNIDMAVSGPDGRVFFSSIASIPVGGAFASLLVEATARQSGDRILVLGFAPSLPPGYVAVVSVPRADFLPSGLLSDYIMMGILALAAILAFVSVMCVLIIRSIARSVLSLEAATRRVAAGELDLPIAEEGASEIASLARSLNSLREEIKEDQARRARFIMGISHDLKTPLALVKGYAEALEEELGGAGEGAAAHLGIIQDKADQLEGMIDDLIDFERVDTGEWSRGLSDVDLGAFLRAFARRLEADAALLGRELRSSIELPSPAPVRMDERLATRAFENLVNNALRYTAQGGRVDIAACVELRRGERVYSVSISDDGPGISDEDLPHVFEPFYRGSASRREQGMGLGLSIVKTVVESHGWEIEARPTAGRGARFVLSIPPAD